MDDLARQSPAQDIEEIGAVRSAAGRAEPT
jgi:hypothetical protein